MVPPRPIILSIFSKPWYYQQTLFFLLHRVGLSFPGIRGHQRGSETSQALSLGRSSSCQLPPSALPRLFREGELPQGVPGGDSQGHLQPRERASSPPRCGPALAKYVPSPFPSALEQTPDLLHRAPGGRERKALETLLTIPPAPSCTVAPNCPFMKGLVCKLVSWYKPSTSMSKNTCLQAGKVTRLPAGWRHLPQLWLEDYLSS